VVTEKTKMHGKSPGGKGNRSQKAAILANTSANYSANIAATTAQLLKKQRSRILQRIFTIPKRVRNVAILHPMQSAY
jgi:hypothetical protein